MNNNLQWETDILLSLENVRGLIKNSIKIQQYFINIERKKKPA